MREMTCASIRARINALQDGPLTEKGSEALDELRRR
jgi:hypothetical protein